MKIKIEKDAQKTILEVSASMTLAQLLDQIFDQCREWGELEAFQIEGRDNLLKQDDLGKALAELGIETNDTIKVVKNYTIGNLLSETVLLHYVTHPKTADLAIAHKLFDRLELDVFNRDECGNTVSHFEARLGGDVKPRQDEVNIQNRLPFHYRIDDSHSENTPLHLCVFYGHSVDPWLAAGAKVNNKNSKGNTPLHLAVKNGHVENVRKLLAAKAEVNEKNASGRTPLHLACGLKNNLEEIIDLLIKNGANIKDETTGYCYRETALILLLENHKACPDQAMIARIMRKFIEKEVNLNAQDASGFTALFYARNNLLYLSILLEAGANPNIKANGIFWFPFSVAPASGTPLEYTGSQEAADYLAKHGAEVPDSSIYLDMTPLKKIYSQSFIEPIFSELVLAQLLDYLPKALLGIIQAYVTLEKEDQQQVVSMAIQRRKALLDPLLTQAEKKSGVLVGTLFSQLFLTPLVEQIPKELLTIIQEYTLENEDQLISLAKKKEILAPDVQDWRDIGQYFYNILMQSQKFLERDILGYWDKKVVSVQDNVLADTIPPVTLDIMRDFIVAKLRAHQSTFAMNPDIINELMESKKGLSEKEKVLTFQHWLKTHWNQEKGESLCQMLQKQMKSQPANRTEKMQIGLAREIYYFLSSHAPFTLGMDNKPQDVKENASGTAVYGSFFADTIPKPSNHPAQGETRLVVEIKKELWALAKLIKKSRDVVLTIPKLSNMEEIIYFYESEKFDETLKEMRKQMDSIPQEAREPEFDLIQKKLKQGLVCVNKLQKIIECQHDLEGKKRSSRTLPDLIQELDIMG